MVDIVQEHVQRLHALAQSALKACPFVCRKYSGNDIEGNRAFGAIAVAIYRERNADPAKQQLRLFAACRDGQGRLAAEPRGELRIVRAQAVGIAKFLREAIASALKHFVESLHGTCFEHLDTFFNPVFNTG